MKQKRFFAGFTLIEMLLFGLIFTLIVTSFITILVAIISVQSRQSAAGETEQQGQFLLQQIQNYIENARLVDMTQNVSTSTLTLREFSSSQDPTVITTAAGIAYLQQGVGGSLQPLTSSRVTISNMTFTRHYNTNNSSTPYGTDSISLTFTVTIRNNNAAQYTQTFQSSYAVNAPIPKIAILQQVKGESNNASVSNVATAYATANESGDLLIAVVANKGLVSVNASDTEGNTWTTVASSSYASFTDQIKVLAALNAKNGTNTVTVSFGSGASYAEVFLYEYRGAATSSSFDVAGAQINSTTTLASSSLVSPTSSVELLLGGTYNENTTEVPAVGPGYTLETSSTALNSTQLFIEDQNQYITGQVASTFTYSQSTPNSLTFLATFR